MTLQYSDKILFGFEDATTKAVPTGSVVYSTCVEKNDVAETVEYKEVSCLTREGKKSIGGKRNVSGSIDFTLAEDNAFFLLKGAMGNPVVTDATASTLSGNTVYAVGDKANHQGSYTLVCTKAGTTSNTLPTLTTADIKKIVTNGTAKFKVYSKLRVSSFTPQYNIEKMAIQVENVEIADSSRWIKQYRHFEVDKVSFNFDPEANMDISMTPVGAVPYDEQDSGFSSFSDTSTYKVIDNIEADAFGGDTKLVQATFGGYPVRADSITIDYTNATNSKNMMNEQTRIERDRSVKGKIVCEMSKQNYENLKLRVSFPLSVVSYTALKHTSITVHLVECKPMFKDPIYEAHDKVMLEIEFDAFVDGLSCVLVAPSYLSNNVVVAP